MKTHSRDNSELLDDCEEHDYIAVRKGDTIISGLLVRHPRSEILVIEHTTWDVCSMGEQDYILTSVNGRPVKGH